MKLFTLCIFFLFNFSTSGIAKENNVLSGEIQSIEGQKIDLTSFQGKPVLVVNIATQCGYTPQLKGLESLYDKYKEKGLVVLGVPSNDFGGQTPEEEKDVKQFCEMRYGVSFPLTAKQVVKGENKHPLIQSLIASSGSSDEIAWNFEKFLISKNGKVIGRFNSKVKPEDSQITDKIDSEFSK